MNAPAPIPNPPYVNDNLGSPAAGDTTLGVEHLRPLFHLLNGDLRYANLADDRVRTWWDFWENNSHSARNRPWMPTAGNHENELGNGPIGYQAYQTYFSLPPTSDQTDLTRGLWYAFTAGSMRVVSIANDDIVYQDGGNSYVRRYSKGAQKAWLEKELATASDNSDIDWVVVCMHQVAISTVDKFNGADLGIRQDWVPLFDKYAVDLVVCGGLQPQCARYYNGMAHHLRTDHDSAIRPWPFLVLGLLQFLKFIGMGSARQQLSYRDDG